MTEVVEHAWIPWGFRQTMNGWWGRIGALVRHGDPIAITTLQNYFAHVASTLGKASPWEVLAHIVGKPRQYRFLAHLGPNLEALFHQLYPTTHTEEQSQYKPLYSPPRQGPGSPKSPFRPFSDTHIPPTSHSHFFCSYVVVLCCNNYLGEAVQPLALVNSHYYWNSASNRRAFLDSLIERGCIGRGIYGGLEEWYAVALSDILAGSGTRRANKYLKENSKGTRRELEGHKTSQTELEGTAPLQ